jgi:hypothetical protein
MRPIRLINAKREEIRNYEYSEQASRGRAILRKSIRSSEKGPIGPLRHFRGTVMTKATNKTTETKIHLADCAEGLLVHPDRHSDVRPQTNVKKDLPTERTCRSRPTTHHHDGCGEFVIDDQKVGRRILFDRTSRLFDPCNYVGDNVRVQTTKRPINFDIAVVPIRREADQFIGPQQAAKAALIGAAGRQTFGFVDDQAGEISTILQQSLQRLQHLLIRKLV